MSEIRPARPEEAADLTQLALRSKAHWGYSAEFMAACTAELTCTAEQLAAGGYWVVEDGGQRQGFYALLKVSPDTIELADLFVEPAQIGRGYGRQLMAHAVAQSRATEHIARLVIQADPNAAEFYERVGARLIGQRPSDSIAGRSLPLYEIDLTEGA